MMNKKMKMMDKGKQADKAAQANQRTANDKKRQMRTCKCRFLGLARERLANFGTRVFPFVAQTYMTSDEGNELIW